MFQVSRTTVAGRSGFSALHTTNQPKYLSAALLILIYNRKSLPHRRAILYIVQCTWYCTARGRNPPVQHNAEPVYENVGKYRPGNTAQGPPRHWLTLTLHVKLCFQISPRNRIHIQSILPFKRFSSSDFLTIKIFHTFRKMNEEKDTARISFS